MIMIRAGNSSVYRDLVGGRTHCPVVGLFNRDLYLYLFVQAAGEMNGIIHPVGLTGGSRSRFKNVFENDLAQDQAFLLQNLSTLFDLPRYRTQLWAQREQPARQDPSNSETVC
ncbi:MAG: hypothetical protein NNA21_11830 [Nitrospira sp.]|nr:hypothetical protein [Nitrospira sp.]MCP9460632.1 hypothetical protein [Nitrospira sp.]MCP9475746.1 hypothetical protein [Nitrospira sp.]